LFAWNVFNFRSLTLDSTLVIAVTYLGTAIAAAILPYRKPDLYNASPIAKYKLFGVPLITVAGGIFAAFLLFLLYAWIIDPQKLYGIGLQNPQSMIYMLIMYLLALAIYLFFRFYRRREGIDINKVHQEIPVE
jgi:amino acid transporter